MKTTRLIIVAVGGQGNLLASRIIGEAALHSNIPARMSEIHGMAQRGGVVESAIVFGDAESTIISDGEADVCVGFEPSETLRALKRCNSKTVVITNLAPLPGNIMAVNMVLLGSLIQTAILPLSPESVKEAIRKRTKTAFIEINLKAFELGFSAAKNGS